MLAAEGDSKSSAEACAGAALRVCEKVIGGLAPLLGAAGVQALLVRSAKLASAEFAPLTDVATPEGLAKLEPCLVRLEPQVATEAAAVLFGTFIDLITTFIGERLTVVALRSAWPAIEGMDAALPAAVLTGSGERGKR
jgi:hypothetical protein